MPWASLVSDVNTTGEILAPGYIFDLPTRDETGQTFNVQTYQGLQSIAQQLGMTVDQLLGMLIENEDILESDIAFKFHIQASATALTRDEFIAQQKAEALKLRQAILLMRAGYGEQFF